MRAGVATNMRTLANQAEQELWIRYDTHDRPRNLAQRKWMPQDRRKLLKMRRFATEIRDVPRPTPMYISTTNSKQQFALQSRASFISGDLNNRFIQSEYQRIK